MPTANRHTVATGSERIDSNARDVAGTVASNEEAVEDKIVYDGNGV